MSSLLHRGEVYPRGVRQATGSHVRGYSIAVAVCIWTVGTTHVLFLNVSRDRLLSGDSGRLDNQRLAVPTSEGYRRRRSTDGPTCPPARGESKATRDK